MSPNQAEQHCADLVKARHRPRFVASLFAPGPVRRALYALYALDAELVHIRRAAPEPMIAAMRYQWWRDTVDPVIQSDRGHPVLRELKVAALGHDLTGADFVALIDGRDDAASGPAAEIAAVSLAARICGDPDKPNVMAERVGAAIALQSQEALKAARDLWRDVRRNRRGELPAYLPASAVDLRHPVSDFALSWRVLTRGLTNRF